MGSYESARPGIGLGSCSWHKAHCPSQWLPFEVHYYLHATFPTQRYKSFVRWAPIRNRAHPIHGWLIGCHSSPGIRVENWCSGSKPNCNSARSRPEICGTSGAEIGGFHSSSMPLVTGRQSTKPGRLNPPSGWQAAFATTTKEARSPLKESHRTSPGFAYG